jgi:hypothetical protein
MSSRVTITLDEAVIERAKNYAAEHNISLSKIIEAYLKMLPQQKQPKGEITPLVKSLSGVIELPPGLDVKKVYSKHISSKYLNK